jgi:succinate dehydrogenase flavin-adding protein (antitoxin of CptAB toxin-antitoxin module)
MGKVTKKKPKKKNSLGPKKKILFDHIGHIREKQTPNYFETLTDADKRTFVNYMINRFLSMDYNLVEVIDQLQKHSVGLKPRDYYRVLIEVVPPGRSFHKYIKATKSSDNDVELVEFIASHFEVSEKEADEYINLFKLTDSGFAELKELCAKYGKESKEVDKLCS